MKVLLLSINRHKAPHPVYPLGLDYVAASLKPHQVRLLDLCNSPLDDSAKEIQQVIKQFSPDAVGISIRNIDNTDAAHCHAFLEDMRTAIQAVRNICNTPIILGGAGYTLFPSELLETLGADFGIVGEGERFKALLDILEKDGPHLTSLPSSVVVRGQSAPSPTPWTGPIQRDAPALNPLLGWYLKHGGMLSLQTQRGCPFRCIYCTYPNIEGTRLRPIDLDEVGKTARALQDAGAKFLFITDSSFNANASHSINVARAFQKAGVSVPWGAFLTPTSMPGDFFKILADAGCSHLEFGTDSVSDQMLERIRKPFRVADIIQAHEGAQSAGIFVAHFLLLGGPGETTQTIDETLLNSEKLNDAAIFFFCGMRIYPNTELHRIAIEEGQIKPEQSLLEPVFYEPSQISLPEIIERVSAFAHGRVRWIIGGGDDRAAKLIWRMYERGSVGPLWERLT